MKRYCLAEDCLNDTLPHLLMCEVHWYMIPRVYRNQYWEQYFFCKHNELTTTEEATAVILRCIEIVAQRERKPEYPKRLWLKSLIEVNFKSCKSTYLATQNHSLRKKLKMKENVEPILRLEMNANLKEDYWELVKLGFSTLRLFGYAALLWLRLTAFFMIVLCITVVGIFLVNQNIEITPPRFVATMHYRLTKSLWKHCQWIGDASLMALIEQEKGFYNDSN